MIGKVSIGEFERHFRVPRHAQDVTHVSEVLPKGLGVYNDVLNVHQRILSLDPREDYMDGPLEGRGGVFQPEGHSRELQEIHVGRERLLVPVGLVHFNLPLSALAV